MNKKAEVEGFLIEIGFDARSALRGLGAIEASLSSIETKLRRLKSIKLNSRNFTPAAALLKAANGSAEVGGKGSTTGAGAKAKTKQSEEELAAIKRRIDSQVRDFANTERMTRMLRSNKAMAENIIKEFRGFLEKGGKPSSDPYKFKRTREEVIGDRISRFRGTNSMLELEKRDRIKAEKIAMEAQKALMARDFKRFGELRREVTSTNKKYRNLDKSITSLTSSFSDLKFAATLTIGTFGALGFGAFQFTNSVLQAGKQVESLKASMQVATGSRRGALKDFEYVSDVAMETGSNLASAATAYTQLSTASKGVLKTSEMKELYEASLETGTALGLSADEVQGMIRAFTQMASKGKVTAEELKGQLGERLPGALNIAADAMGVTTSELFKMLEAGELASKDFLPKMSKEMRNLVRDSGALSEALKTVRVQENRLQTTFLMFRDDIANDGVMSAYSGMLETISGFLDVTSGQSDETREAIASMMTDVLKSLDTFIKWALPKLEELSKQYNDWRDTIGEDDLSSVWKGWAKGIATMTAGVWGLVKALKALKGLTTFFLGSATKKALGVASGAGGTSAALSSGIGAAAGSLLTKPGAVSKVALSVAAPVGLVVVLDKLADFLTKQFVGGREEGAQSFARGNDTLTKAMLESRNSLLSMDNFKQMNGFTKFLYDPQAAMMDHMNNKIKDAANTKTPGVKLELKMKDGLQDLIDYRVETGLENMAANADQGAS